MLVHDSKVLRMILYLGLEVRCTVVEKGKNDFKYSYLMDTSLPIKLDEEDFCFSTTEENVLDMTRIRSFFK
jgi:hypothetical protein